MLSSTSASASSSSSSSNNNNNGTQRSSWISQQPQAPCKMSVSRSVSSLESYRSSMTHGNKRATMSTSASTSALATTASSSSSSSSASTGRLSTSSSTSTLVNSFSASQQPSKPLSPVRSLPKSAMKQRSESFRLTVPKSPQAANVVVQQRPVIFEEEYQEEVIAYMHSLEAASLPTVDLMDSQPELRWFMRPYLVDFLIEIQQTFRLKPETLYLAMNIVDRYVSKRIVFKRHYQLVGSAALLMAAKYEDVKDRVPTVYDLSCMCCQAYDETAFIQMEGHILQTLQWSIGHPTAEAWLRICFMQSPGSTKVQNVARFLMETTLFHRDFVGVPASQIASASLMLARYICQEEPNTTKPSGQVASVAQMIDYHLGHHLSELSTILLKKYNSSHFSSASSTVRNFYVAAAELKKKAEEEKSKKKEQEPLLPAAAMSVKATSASVVVSNEDNDVSMDTSIDSSPSSIGSTPSRSTSKRRSRHDDDDDDDDDEDDDTDMPITPLHDQTTYSVSTSMSISLNGTPSPSPCPSSRRRTITSSSSSSHSHPPKNQNAESDEGQDGRRRTSSSIQRSQSIKGNIPAIVVNQ